MDSEGRVAVRGWFAWKTACGLALALSLGLHAAGAVETVVLSGSTNRPLPETSRLCRGVSNRGLDAWARTAARAETTELDALVTLSAMAVWNLLFPSGLPGLVIYLRGDGMSDGWVSLKIETGSIGLRFHRPTGISARSCAVMVHDDSRVASAAAAQFREECLRAGVAVVELRRNGDEPASDAFWSKAEIREVIRAVRSEAERRKLETNRIGVCGFGTEAVSALMASDCERLSSGRPDFSVVVSPRFAALKRPLTFDAAIPAGIVGALDVGPQAAPSCIMAGENDADASVCAFLLTHRLRVAGVSAECHVLAVEGDLQSSSVTDWSGRALDWMFRLGVAFPANDP